jgi:hypothetical protein
MGNGDRTMKLVYILFILFFNYSAFAGNIKNILILHSYDSTYKWTSDIQKGISEEFLSLNNAHIYIEYMDTKRFYSKTYLNNLKKFYINKYKQIPINLIIASDDNAFNFVKELKKITFKDIHFFFAVLISCKTANKRFT